MSGQFRALGQMGQVSAMTTLGKRLKAKNYRDTSGNPVPSDPNYEMRLNLSSGTPPRGTPPGQTRDKLGAAGLWPNGPRSYGSDPLARQVPSYSHSRSAIAAQIATVMIPQNVVYGFMRSLASARPSRVDDIIEMMMSATKRRRRMCIALAPIQYMHHIATQLQNTTYLIDFIYVSGPSPWPASRGALSPDISACANFIRWIPSP
jgi:hypothetical protein